MNTTKWTQLKTIEEITLAVKRKDEIQVKTKYVWEPWRDYLVEHDLLPKRSRQTNG